MPVIIICSQLMAVDTKWNLKFQTYSFPGDAANSKCKWRLQAFIFLWDAFKTKRQLFVPNWRPLWKTFHSNVSSVQLVGYCAAYITTSSRNMNKREASRSRKMCQKLSTLMKIDGNHSSNGLPCLWPLCNITRPFNEDYQCNQKINWLATSFIFSPPFCAHYRRPSSRLPPVPILFFQGSTTPSSGEPKNRKLETRDSWCVPYSSSQPKFKFRLNYDNFQRNTNRWLFLP